MFSESFLITLITAVVGPVVVLYIANRVKNMKPRGDRIDKAFEMYESILLLKDKEIASLKEELLQCKNDKKT